MPIPSHKLYPNWKLCPFLKHILSVFNFVWLLVCALYVGDQIIGFKVIHMDKMRISYKNEGGVFQVDALCYRGYTNVFFLGNEVLPKEYTLISISPLHARLFSLFLTL